MREKIIRKTLLKRILIICFTVAFVLSSLTFSFAGEIVASGGKGTSVVNLSIAAARFSVTLPTSLPVEVSADGTVTVSNSAKITNNSDAAVAITNMEIEAVSPWQLVDYTTDFNRVKVGSKKIAFNLFGNNVPENGVCDLTGVESIQKDYSLSINYTAKMAAQKTALNNMNAANVVFTVGWGEYASIEPGLYNDGVMTASWDELLADEVIHVNEGVLTTNIDMETGENPSAADLVGELVIDDSVTSIGDYGLSFCTNLTGVDIPSTVTNIGMGAFGGCENLTSVTIPSSVTSIGDAAFGMSGLTNITIESGAIGNQVFIGCTSLTSVTIGNGVTSIGEMAFRECTSLTSVDIPSSVETIGNQVFFGCTNLTSVTIENGVTSIGSSAFESCTNLTSIEIPDSVETIGESAFYDCTSLTSVKLGSGITTIEHITFSGCTNLPSITIGVNITYVDYSAFTDCSSLTDVYYAGTEAEWNSITIKAGNNCLLNATIHYESTMPE